MEDQSMGYGSGNGKGGGVKHSFILETNCASEKKNHRKRRVFYCLDIKPGPYGS